MAGTWLHLVRGGRSGCPHGRCCIFVPAPGDGSAPVAQKPGAGWHRAENPHGAAAVEAGGGRGDGPSQHVSVPPEKPTLHPKGTLSPSGRRGKAMAPQDAGAGGPGLSWEQGQRVPCRQGMPGG